MILAMPNSAKPIVISPSRVIGRMIAMLKAIPSAAVDLPAAHITRAFWKKLFAANPRTRLAMELLRELPAFTEYAPRDSNPLAWRKLMVRDFQGPAPMVPETARQIVQQVLAAAKPRPKKKVKYWRDAFAATEVVQRVRPRESDEYLPNPHRGTTTFQRFQGDDIYPHLAWSDTHGPLTFRATGPIRDNLKYIPRTTLSYCRWPWAWLEPEKGKYNWSIVDCALATARLRGQTLQTRFQPYTQRVDYKTYPITGTRHPPEVSVNVPDWYWDTGARWIAKGPYARHEVDSNDPRYLRHFGDFVRAFARRYDGHEDLESVDIAFAGFWGESGGNARPGTAVKLVDVYLRAFRKTMLVRMLGSGGEKVARHLARSGRRVGWRADCMGDLRRKYGAGVPPELCWNHLYDNYPNNVEIMGVKDAWMTAPVTLETCGNPPSWFLGEHDIDYIIRDACRHHVSVFMPKSAFYPRTMRDKLIDFDKMIGYRFALRQMLLPLAFKAGLKVDVEFFIDNVGCAPIYRPYTLALRFRQSPVFRIVRFQEDIRRWRPGYSWFREKILLPRGFGKGQIKVDLGIINDQDVPKVFFAIKDERLDGWHPVANMEGT